MAKEMRGSMVSSGGFGRVGDERGMMVVIVVILQCCNVALDDCSA